MRRWRLGAFGILSIFASTVALAVSAPRLVADLATVPSPTDGSKPHAFATLGSYVVFAAQPDDHADRLFRSDGTRSDTVELAAPCGALENGSISLLHAAGDRAFYSVVCGYSTESLWTSDGTAAGMRSLLAPGEFHLTSPFFPTPGWIEDRSSTLFLAGGNYASALELWRTDGSPDGTSRLATLSRQYGATGAIARQSKGDFLLLVWEHFASLKIWRSDGTAIGTGVVTAIDFGSPAFAVRSFATTAGGISFMAEVSDPWEEQLWHTDGTSAGTIRLASFDVGFWNGLVENEGSIYFTATAGGESGIWRSDGTVATTRRIAALEHLEISPDSFAFLGDRIYWLGFAEDRSSGALFGAPLAGGNPEELLQQCVGGECDPRYENLWLQSVGGALVFSRREAGHSSVWHSDGQLGGDSSQLAALCDGEFCSGWGAGPVVLGDDLFFVRSTLDGTLEELWLSDGTANGTLRLAGPVPALAWFGAEAAHALAEVPGGGWLFSAGDALHGRELWHARREADSGALVVDLRLDRPGIDGLESVGIAGSTFVFGIQDPNRTRTLYRHELGGVSVEPFLTIPVILGRYGSRNPPPSLRPAGNAWYLFESDFDGDQSSEEFAQQVWRYDTLSGASRPLFPDPATTGIGALAHDLFPSGSDYVLLGSRDVERNPAIYRLQPATGAISKLIDLPATFVWSIGRSGEIWFLIEDGSRVVAFDLERRSRQVVADFAAGSVYQADALPFGLIFEVTWPVASGDGRKEIWLSDGSAAGTREIAEWPSQADGCLWIQLPTRSAESPVIFAVETSCGASGELWISDGSAARTRMLRTFPDRRLGVVDGGLRFSGELYFLSSRQVGPAAHWESALWKTNGTPAGTAEVAALASSDSDFPALLFGARGAEGLYFPWRDAEHGLELWRSDGTALGTVLAADLEPGPESSFPSGLQTVGDQVLFSALTLASGTELWQVDGGLAAPQLVADLYPGPESSSPVVLDGNDEVLFFQADDGLVGREIWEVDRPSVAPCVSSATTLCLANSRFRARAERRDFAGEMGAAGAVPLTGDSGYLWFFAPGNPEVMLKIVDACGLPGFENFWAYSTGLTNVEVELDVVDTWSGERQSVRTALGEAFGPLFDSGSFHVCDGGGAGAPRAAASEPPPAAPAEVLPLLDGRFAGTASWETLDGRSGDGQAVPISSDSGYFWFFAPSIVELLVKMVDACGYPGFDNFWLFAGGLTDVEVHLTVRDTLTGEVVVHDNEQGHPFEPLLETGRLRVCNPAP